VYIIEEKSDTFKRMRGGLGMEVAKITNRGQITIPIGVREKLGVKEGDKVIFIEDGSRIVVVNAAKIAFANMRAAFAGEAERLGLKDVQDVVNLVDEVRAEMWQERYADNA
jgi:AbrB family looped-hinge helix DNA binding protein